MRLYLHPREGESLLQSIFAILLRVGVQQHVVHLESNTDPLSAGSIMWMMEEMDKRFTDQRSICAFVIAGSDHLVAVKGQRRGRQGQQVLHS